MSIYVFFYNQIPKYTMTCRFKFLSDLIIFNTLIKSPEVEVTVPNDATIESFTHFTISDLHSLAEIEFPNILTILIAFLIYQNMKLRSKMLIPVLIVI